MKPDYKREGSKTVFVVVLSLLLAGSVQANEVIRHSLSFPKDQQQTFLVRSEFPVQAATTVLLMPNWTPGSYLMREFAANVNQLSVRSDDGRQLQARKSAKDRWQVETAGVSNIIVDYVVFTPDLNVNSSWASEAFSLINGASVFLYTAGTRALPQTLKMDIAPERGEVFTAMQLSADGETYLAENYDVLVDSPVAIAHAPVYRFKHKKQAFVLVNVGENEFWDGQQAADDIASLVKETRSFWKSNPLTRPFWFLNFAVDGRGGLEHDHSTVIMTGRRQMRSREEYVKWLGVVAHEFFHVWNVRKMRPLELADYDYQNEQYSSQLWLAEGLTSYYDNLLLSRAGLIKPDEYTELLARDIHRIESTPGRHQRPVTEASWDAWIRHYKPDSNAVNSTVSYYTKGAVIGFVLDAWLRKESNDRHDLDEVMREMYTRHENTAYTAEDFMQVVAEVGGTDAVAFLRPLLYTTAELEVDTALDWFGLRLNRDPDGSQTEADGMPAVSGLGVIWDDNQHDLVVKSVLSGSSGSIAGILPGDEVLAIGDERLTKVRLASLMTTFQPEQITTVLVSRRDKIVKLDVKLEAAIPDRFEIVLQPRFGKRHIRRLERLLGQKLGQ